jgi:hypothetical protein
LEICHDEADAREQLANVVLDFGHDPSRRGPAVRLIVEALVPDERRATGPTRRPKQEVLDRQLQVLVGRDTDGVLDAACLQRLVDLRPCEGGVGPERDRPALGLLAVDLGHEELLPVVRAGDVARTQLRRQTVPVVIEQEKRVITVSKWPL